MPTSDLPYVRDTDRASTLTNPSPQAAPVSAAGQVTRGAASEGPLSTADPGAIEMLRAALDRAGFTEAGIREALKDPSQRLELKRIDFPLYERRLASPEALNTLVKLFMMQLWVNVEQVEKSIAPLTVERLVGTGLLQHAGSNVRATCALALCDGFIIAHDRVTKESEAPQADHVLGVNASAATLAFLTVRRPGARALDIGTGSGIQALLASRHSSAVIGTDTNPRALNYAAFNASLNHITNIVWRKGSLFEPVAGHKFDLITCNPPYVISPESHLVFRDSGLPGDLICEQIVRQAPQHLLPGGFACILCNWVHKPDEDWSQPVRRWVEDSGCDAWLLRGTTEDPLSYAAAWNRSHSSANYGDALDRWCEYYTRSGIAALAMGALIIRRRSDNKQPWFRADDWPGKPSEPCGDHILRVFESEDHSRATADEALLEQSFTLAEEHRVSQHMKFTNGDLGCQLRRLQLERGLRFECNLDQNTMLMLSHCDGKHSMKQAVQTLASSTGLPPEHLRPHAIAVVRKLLGLGFLVPISGS